MTNDYQMCVVCVMDTTDPKIVFFGNEGCNHCIQMKASLGHSWFNDSTGERPLAEIIEKIKFQGRGVEYDSILGLSGGADSSYLALKAFDWGLRPLVVHVDGGWNTELAVRNIQSILNFTGWDLQTNVIDWNEMKALQISYFKSGISNLDVPQDHAFFSSLYSFAVQNNIKYVLSGGNTSTEGIFPTSWHGAAMDAINLKAIHEFYGGKKLTKYPQTSFFEYYCKYPFLKGMRTVRPLNYFPYNKEKALLELELRVGYQRYPRKHGESSFTRFFQEYFLPNRFGMDKRLPHFSSLIVSGQISREDALAELQKPMYGLSEAERDIDFICRKLEISRNEFEDYLNTPLNYAGEFANWDRLHAALKFLQGRFEKLSGKRIRVFS
jgi:N-acetyl sugar amidotransferase